MIFNTFHPLRFILLTQHLITITLSLNPKMQYYGDVSFKSEYLPQMCSNLTSKYLFFYIENLIIKNATFLQTPANESAQPKVSPMRAYLQQLNCRHEFYSEITVNDIIYSFLSDDTFKYRRFLAIFDFTSQRHITGKTDSLSIWQFNKVMTVLSNLFIFCFDCFPFMALFEHSERLKTLAEDSFPELAARFQASLIGVDSSYQSVSVLHIRPTLDGCLHYPGVFLPASQPDFVRLRAQYHSCNLHGLTLNISMREYPAMCEFAPVDDPVTGQPKPIGFTMETTLLAQLARSYNFRSRIVLHRGQKMNSIYGKLMAEVYYGRSQLAMCAVVFRPERFTLVDNTKFLVSDTITFISRNDRLANRDWIVFRPFGLYIWLLILTIFAFLLVIFYLALKLDLSKRSQQLFYYDKVLVSLRLYAIFVSQSTSVWREPNSSSRLKYGVWMLAALILAQIYNSIFNSIITLPEYEPPIDSVADLLAAISDDSHLIYLAANFGVFKYAFLKATPERNRVFHQIGRHLNRTGGKNVYANENYLIPTVEANGQRNIVIAARRVLVALKNLQTVTLHIAQESLVQSFTTMAIAKKSPLLEPFNKLIKTLHEAGVIEFWISKAIKDFLMRKSWELKKTIVENIEVSQGHYARSSFKTFRVYDLKSIFILWSSGMAIAIIILIVEVCFYIF